MNWYSQLAHLILDYYRENVGELQQLSLLKRCKLTRRWGTLRIACRDNATAIALTGMEGILNAPVAELRLAQQIHILVNGTLIATFTVTAPPTVKYSNF